MLVVDVGEIASIEEELEEARFDDDDEEKLNILVKKGGLVPFANVAEAERGFNTAVELPSSTFTSSIGDGLMEEVVTFGRVALLLGAS